MRVINTSGLTPGSKELTSSTEKLFIYNGLDCCLTTEIAGALLPQLDNLTSSTYAFSRELQGPILDMNLFGVRVDFQARDRAVSEYQGIISRIEGNFSRLLKEGLGVKTEFNWRSPDQIKYLFYDVMGIPPVKNKGKITTNRDALEKIRDNYWLAEPLVRHILLLRDIGKKVSVLKTGIDSDGRIRTTFNIGGTNTGRLSSSMSEFEETGTNLQNIEERLRRIFIADPGMKFAYIDLEQAESRAVGAICWNRFRVGTYLDACESGDLHTTVCKMTAPSVPWTGDPAKDKELAEQPFYRQHSRRHMNKVLGHGTNYYGQPPEMAKHTKIEQHIISEFQRVYFEAFPEIKWMHEWRREQLKIDGYIVSLMGRKRWFFGRRTDEETLRKAIAYDPQGSVGDILNTGMLRVWWTKLCQLLLQVHDAILVQYPEEKEDEILPQLLDLIKVPVHLEHKRTLVIPSEAKVGWNWASASKDNPDGLVKYKGNDSRKRLDDPKVSFLDRRVY